MAVEVVAGSKQFIFKFDFSRKISFKNNCNKQMPFGPFSFDLYKDISPIFQNVFKYVLIQDPIKIASGFTLGFFIKDFIEQFLNKFLKPILMIVLSIFSKSSFSYTIAGQEIDFGGIFIQIVIFTTFMFIFYYGFVNPIDKLRERYNIDQKTSACPYCKTLINREATRCPSCTSQLSSLPS